MAKRTIEYKVRLSPAEAKELNTRVKKCRLSREAYLRHLIAGSIPREAPPPDYYAMMQEIYKLRVVLQALLDRGASEVEVAEMCAKLDRLILDITEAVIVPKRVR